MRPSTAFIVVALLGALSACGFGFADDSGAPVPATDYWGWQCADGSRATDAGCPQGGDAGNGDGGN